MQGRSLTFMKFMYKNKCMYDNFLFFSEGAIVIS